MNELDIINTKIQFLIPSLSKGEKVAADYIVSNLGEIGEQELAVISSSTGVSQATVIRLCKRMGYTGFLEFKKAVRSAKYSPRENRIPKEPERDACQIMNNVIEQNMAIMKRAYALITGEYERAVEALLSARVIYMFGNGDAIIPCELLEIKLMKIGIPCWVVNDQDLQLLSASSMSERDVALAVSHTGRSKSVVEAMKKARERGAATIGITGAAKSPLVRYCDIILNTGNIDDTTGGDIIARRIAEQVIMETIYLKILNRMEDSVKSKKREGVENISIYKIEDTETGDDQAAVSSETN